MDYSSIQLMQQSNTTSSLISLIAGIAVIAGMWKVFEKAGKPGWAAIVPFYNIYIMLEIVGRPAWWLVLIFVPLVNIVIFIILSLDMGKAFGKDGVWSFFLLVLFAFVGYPLLGFGDGQYKGAPHTRV